MWEPKMGSRNYLFVRSRELEGTFPGEAATGAWSVSGARVLKGWGIPDETEWPYDGDAAHWPPTAPVGIDSKAKKGRIFAYKRVRKLEEVKRSLANKMPVVASMRIRLEDWAEAKDGTIPPIGRQETDSSHTVALFGYDNNKQTLTLRNSWGPRWGDNGYGYMPSGDFCELMLEAWVEVRSPERPIIGNRGQDVRDVVRTWGLPEDEHEILHGVEWVIPSKDEVIGWAFARQEDNYLEVEELFVKPGHRRRGYGKKIYEELVELAERERLALRLWIPHVDVSPSGSPGSLHKLFKAWKLEVHMSPYKWASYLAETE